MVPIKRIGFKPSGRSIQGFEITTLSDFNQPHKMAIARKHYRVNFYSLIYITKGSGHHEIDFEVFPLQAGQIALINRHRVHRYMLNDSMEGYIIHFTDTFLYTKDMVHAADIIDPFLNQYRSPIVNLSAEEGSLTRQLFHILFQLANQAEDAALPTLLHAHFRTIMLHIQHQRSQTVHLKDAFGHQLFIQFMDLVEKHYKSKRAVKDYADLLHVTTKTINQHTRQAVDQSAKDFIINRLVLEIKRYLSTGELTMAEIAEELGFSEQTNMTKFFRKHGGMTPSAFVESQKVSV